MIHMAFGSYNFLFSEIMKLARVEEESQVSRMTQCEEDHFEMLVRAANIVMLILIQIEYLLD